MSCKDYFNLDMGKTFTGLIKKICKKEDELMSNYGLTHFHSRYIMNIYKFKSLTMADLTDLVGVDKANTTRVVKDLLSHEIVIKTGGERKFSLSLTDKGKKIAKFFKSKIDNFLKQVFKDFTEHEIENLRLLLDKLFIGMENSLEGE